tara:strand:- start:7 stop:1932 length:1926 start_codon:yes stop_codon:yes gene_type:complete
MVQSYKKNDGLNSFSEVSIFSGPLFIEWNQENMIISTNIENQFSKEEIINQAFMCHSKGKISEAEKYYKYFINQGFNDYRVFNNYGSILKDLGKIKDAEIFTRKAIELKPDFADSYYNLGNILHNLGNLKEAEIFTRKAIELKPNFAEAYSNLGILLRDLGNLKEAEISQRKAIQLDPKYANAHNNLGTILIELGILKEAEISTRKAIELNSNFAEAYSNLGSILKDLGQLKEGEIFQRKAIEINPYLAVAHYNLGNTLIGLGKFKKAELSHLRAIELNPNFADAHANLGVILIDNGKLKEAELSLRKAIQIYPDHAEAYSNLAFIELLKGNYQSGLEHYEFRFKQKKAPSLHGNPVITKIDNQKVNKGEKLLVVTEQGLGDTLQYMRYVPYLRNQGFDISFCAQTKLHSLIKASGIEANPLPPEQSALISEGQWIPLLSLPRYLSISPENPIITKPYINSTIELNQKWKNILYKEKRPIIGINWQGNQETEKTYQGRSIPLEIFSILNHQNEITMISLQKGFGSEQLDHCSFKNKFIQCQDQIDLTWDFLENAAIIENCDLIITCDTSIAHLAGGMGKKVWLLLRDIPFWTWGLEGDSSFWYPSMRLFRQKERHNWDEVMERVSSELKAEICNQYDFKNK